MHFSLSSRFLPLSLRKRASHVPPSETPSENAVHFGDVRIRSKFIKHLRIACCNGGKRKGGFPTPLSTEEDLALRLCNNYLPASGQPRPVQTTKHSTSPALALGAAGFFRRILKKLSSPQRIVVSYILAVFYIFCNALSLRCF